MVRCQWDQHGDDSHCPRDATQINSSVQGFLALDGAAHSADKGPIPKELQDEYFDGAHYFHRWSSTIPLYRDIRWTVPVTFDNQCHHCLVVNTTTTTATTNTSAANGTRPGRLFSHRYMNYYNANNHSQHLS
jgi:hypothetical protein